MKFEGTQEEWDALVKKSRAADNKVLPTRDPDYAQSLMKPNKEEMNSRQVYKYIVVDGGAILFPEAVIHRQVAHGFTELKQRVYSAGFCVVQSLSSGTIIITCYGESTSLGIKSQPIIDSRVISETMFSMVNPYKYGIKTIKEQYE